MIPRTFSSNSVRECTLILDDNGYRGRFYYNPDYEITEDMLNACLPDGRTNSQCHYFETYTLDRFNSKADGSDERRILEITFDMKETQNLKTLLDKANAAKVLAETFLLSLRDKYLEHEKIYKHFKSKEVAK